MSPERSRTSGWQTETVSSVFGTWSNKMWGWKYFHEFYHMSPVMDSWHWDFKKRLMLEFQHLKDLALESWQTWRVDESPLHWPDTHLGGQYLRARISKTSGTDAVFAKKNHALSLILFNSYTQESFFKHIWCVHNLETLLKLFVGVLRLSVPDIFEILPIGYFLKVKLLSAPCFKVFFECISFGFQQTFL